MQPMKLLLVMCLTVAFVPAAHAQQNKEFSGKISKIEKDSIELKDKQGAAATFRIGSKLVADANLNKCAGSRCLD